MPGVLGGLPVRGTAAATDLFDSGVPGYIGTMSGAKLSAAAAAATAQLVDADGTVLADLSAPVNGADYADIPVQFKRKVRLLTLTGAGAIVNAWVQ